MNRPQSFLRADIGRERSFGEWYFSETHPDQRVEPHESPEGGCSTSEFLPGLNAAQFSRPAEVRKQNITT